MEAHTQDLVEDTFDLLADEAVFYRPPGSDDSTRYTFDAELLHGLSKLFMAVVVPYLVGIASSETHARFRERAQRGEAVVDDAVLVELSSLLMGRPVQSEDDRDLAVAAAVSLLVAYGWPRKDAQATARRIVDRYAG